MALASECPVSWRRSDPTRSVTGRPVVTTLLTASPEQCLLLPLHNQTQATSAWQASFSAFSPVYASLMPVSFSV